MNILFYVEPHPLRDSFISHSYPFNLFATLCRQIINSNDISLSDVDVRIFSSHVLQEIKFDEVSDLWPVIITPTSEEQNNIESMSKMWLPHGLRDWIELCSNPDSAIALFYYSVLDRIRFNEFEFDVIVSWGQNAAIKSYAAKHGIQTIYFEMASMRSPFPRALLMDPQGVNGEAVTTNISIQDIEGIFNNLEREIVLSTLNDEFLQDRQSSNLYYSKYNYSAVMEKILFKDNRKKVALIPLQLADDANLLLYSNFSSIEEFVDNALAELNAKGWNVIIKSHPHARLRGGYVERVQTSCLKKYGDLDNVCVVKEDIEADEYLSLLASVDLVVTNNSSLGFEALLVGTQCVTMGKSCYSIKGGLPSIKEYLAADELELKEYERRGSLVAVFMLAIMFPLERRLAEELIKRIRLWKPYGEIGSHNKEDWIRTSLHELGWSTWFNRARMIECFSKINSEKEKISEDQREAV